MTDISNLGYLVRFVVYKHWIRERREDKTFTWVPGPSLSHAKHKQGTRDRTVEEIVALGPQYTQYHTTNDSDNNWTEYEMGSENNVN